MNLDELRPLAAGVVALAELWPGHRSQRPQAAVAVVARMLGLNVLHDTVLPGLNKAGLGEEAAVTADRVSLARLQLATAFVAKATTLCPHDVAADAGRILFSRLQSLTVSASSPDVSATPLPLAMFPAGGKLATLDLREFRLRGAHLAAWLRALPPLQGLRELSIVCSGKVDAVPTMPPSHNSATDCRTATTRPS